MRAGSIKGETAFITGASSGIGMACAKRLAALGVNLILTARRMERLLSLAKKLADKHGIEVIPFKLDVRVNEQVENVFKSLAREGKEIDILINNAGLALSTDKMPEGIIENWDTMIDTNLKGLLYVTRATLSRMVERNFGHIINIGSVAGHDCYVGGNIYAATKHAVRAISKSLRMDLFGTAIRVSEIAPGAVETEFSEVRWKDKARAKKLYEGFCPLTAEDIADAVGYVATRPAHVNISELVIYPQAQASVSQIHRLT